MDIRSVAGSRAAVLVASTVVVLGTALAYWLIRPSTEAAPMSVAVARADIQETVSALGVVVPSQYVDVGAQVSGQLLKLHVRLGDTVQRGQLVAAIDPTRYAAQVAQDRAVIADLEAQMAGWEGRLALARWTYGRNTRLASEGAATEQVLEQGKAELKTAETTLASLRAQLERAHNVLKVDEANLGYTEIRAPISGLVISPTSAVYGNAWTKLDIVHEGQTLNANQNAPVLLRIADLQRMRVRTQVSEADIARLKLGMPVQFTTLGRPEQRISARLGAIEPTPELVNGAIFYNAAFEVANTDGNLLPQMTAQVYFVVAQASEALVVPSAALASARRQTAGDVPGCPPQPSDGDADCVQVLVAGRAQARPVTVGVKNDVAVQILAGLAEGEQVVIAGASPGGVKTGGGKNGGGKNGANNGGP